MNNVFINNVANKLDKIAFEEIATQSVFDKTDDDYQAIDNLCNYLYSLRSNLTESARYVLI